MGRRQWLAAFLAVSGALGLLLPLANPLLAEGPPSLAWLLDLFNHWQWLYLPLVVLGALIGCLKDRRWLLLLLMTPLPLFTSAPTLPQAPSNATGPQLGIASANVHLSAMDVTPLAQWLTAEQPDLAILLEVSPVFAKGLPRLAEYPYQVIEPEDSPFGIALLSRWPIVTSTVEHDDSGIPYIRATIAFAGQQIGVTAFHPMPPLSMGFHQRQVALLTALARRNQASNMPSLLAGDLNATPWSQAFAGLDELGWRRASGLRPTWPSVGQGVFGIPIDHVLASREWQVENQELGPDLGSDHRPILVRLQLNQASTGLHE